MKQNVNTPVIVQPEKYKQTYTVHVSSHLLINTTVKPNAMVLDLYQYSNLYHVISFPGRVFSLDLTSNKQTLH